jgi:atlastin
VVFGTLSLVLPDVMLLILVLFACLLCFRNYIRPHELKDDHRVLFAKALDLFDSMATFGSRKSIEAARDRVMEQILADWEVYQSLNEGRNPLAGFET